jgi:hypothetical protein
MKRAAFDRFDESIRKLHVERTRIARIELYRIKRLR